LHGGQRGVQLTPARERLLDHATVLAKRVDVAGQLDELAHPHDTWTASSRRARRP
jgi:DNA-binding transcriptional LysR family regulator